MFDLKTDSKYNKEFLDICFEVPNSSYLGAFLVPKAGSRIPFDNAPIKCILAPIWLLQGACM